MAGRKGSEGGSDKGRVKVRVIEFEMDGSNQTLRDSIRDIVGAIGRGPTIVRIANQTALADDNRSPTPLDDDDSVGVEEAEDGGAGGSDDETPRRQRAAPRTPVVLDIDLKTGAIPLVDFLSKLNLDKDTDKYAAIAHWMKSISGQNISEITADHIHTGFRAMKWGTPNDAAAPLRALKGRKYGYMKSGSKAGTFILNHVGENHVMDLMKSKGIDL